MTTNQKTKVMSVTGIVLYDIELDGCLNGVYTNNHAEGEIYNEVARKRPDEDKNCLTGSYDTVYFDAGNTPVNATLTISRAKDSNGNALQKTYKFKWKVKGNILFEGIGYYMNSRQIAVLYKDEIDS